MTKTMIARRLHKILILECLLLSVTISQPGCQTRENVNVQRNSASMTDLHHTEKQITRGPGGRILTNTGVWSPDSEWIVYDARSDPAGDSFDGDSIAMV